MEDHGKSAPEGLFSGGKKADMESTGDFEPIGTKNTEKGSDLDASARPGSVTCSFCHQSFCSKGSLGRHLDRKKGELEHPAAQVEEIRGKVRRRFHNRGFSGRSGISDASAPPPSRTPDARRKAAKKYNSQESVKERNRQRRRARDLSIRAQIAANRWYVGEILQGSHTSAIPESSPDFPSLVAKIVPPKLWPPLGLPPGDIELKHTVKIMSGTAYNGPITLQSLLDEYAAWEDAEEGKKLQEWQAAQDRALRQLGASLWEVQYAGDMIKRKQMEIYEGYTVDDFYIMESDEGEGNGVS